MALRVWLPLNGNLNNQGLSNCAVVNSGATIDNSGKIGKTYLFDANDDFISIDSADMRNIFKGGNIPFTIAFWIYNTKTTGSRAVPFGDYGLTGTIGFNLEINSNAGNWNNDIRFYWNGNPDYRATGTELTTNTWVHLVVAYDGTKVDFYRNGILANTRNGTLNTLNKTSGAFYLGRDNRTGGTAFGGRINDFRVYDECLSQKQIKEISKGLVAHYKMIGSGANENIIPISFSSSWNTNGSTNTFTKLSDYSFSIQYTADTISGASGRYKGINGYFTEGKTYTFSYDLKGDGNYKIKAGFESSANIVTTTTYFKRYSCTYTATTTNWQAIVFYASGNDNGLSTGSTITIRNMKLEEGEIATRWEPAHADTLYTALGYANDICTDVSGNGYTAIKNGTLTFNTDSPRYSGSTKFDSGYFHKVPSPLNTSSDAFTISCWFYPTKNTTQTLINDRKSTGDGLSVFYLGGGIRFDTGANYQWLVGTITVNAWNHVVVTWDKIAGNKKLYLNGNLINTTTNYGTLAQIGDVFSIGNSSTNGAAGAGNQVYGSISDFRIYATALSADDILTMYKNSGIIDNKGNVYAYEFKEE